MILVRFGLERVFTDHIQRSKFTRFHRLKHLRKMPAFLRRNLDAPLLFEFLAQGNIFDVLETSETIRQSAHITAALNIVLASKRIEPAAVLSDVPSQQRKVDQRQDIVHRVVVFRNSQRPANHCPMRARKRVSHVANGLRRHSRFAFRVFKRVRFDGPPVDMMPLVRGTLVSVPTSRLAHTSAH